MVKAMNNKMSYLVHYGTPRHSGRYPWGSGEHPRQSERTKNGKRLIQKDDINLDQFKTNIDELRSLGVKIDSNKKYENTIILNKEAAINKDLFIVAFLACVL